MVPRAGLEPARPNGHQILSLTCLPIPPSRRGFVSVIIAWLGGGVYEKMARAKPETA